MPTLYVQQKKKIIIQLQAKLSQLNSENKPSAFPPPPMLHKKEKEKKINTLFEKCLCFLNNFIWQLYSKAAQIHPVLNSPKFNSGPQF